MADDQNVYDYVRERTARGLGEPVPPPPEEPLNRGGGGGTFDGMDDARLASVESRLTNIESEQRMHFRWSIGTTLALAISLAGLIFTSSAFLMSRVDRVEDR